MNLVVGAKTDSGRLAARLAGGRVSNWRARRRRKVLAVLKVDVHAVIVHKGRVLFQDGAPRRFFHHRAKKFCRKAINELRKLSSKYRSTQLAETKK